MNGLEPVIIYLFYKLEYIHKIIQTNFKRSPSFINTILFLQCSSSGVTHMLGELEGLNLYPSVMAVNTRVSSFMSSFMPLVVGMNRVGRIGTTMFESSYKT